MTNYVSLQFLKFLTSSAVGTVIHCQLSHVNCVSPNASYCDAVKELFACFWSSLARFSSNTFPYSGNSFSEYTELAGVASKFK